MQAIFLFFRDRILLWSLTTAQAVSTPGTAWPLTHALAFSAILLPWNVFFHSSFSYINTHTYYSPLRPSVALSLLIFTWVPLPFFSSFLSSFSVLLPPPTTTNTVSLPSSLPLYKGLSRSLEKFQPIFLADFTQFFIQNVHLQALEIVYKELAILKIF